MHWPPLCLSLQSGIQTKKQYGPVVEWILRMPPEH